MWNSIELFDKPKNAQLAREFQLDLPLQLSQNQNIELAKEYAHQLVREGMVVDLCVHAPDKENPNPHAHLMATMRPLNKDGTWGAKSINEPILDENGEKIKLANGNYKSRKIDTTDWNKDYKIEQWRKQLADLSNQYLERYGHPERVTHESYERQGIDQVATVRLSQMDYEKEQRGIQTERGNINRQIKEENHQREEYKLELAQINQEIEKEKEQDRGKGRREEQPFLTVAERYERAMEKNRKGQGKENEEPPLSYRERYDQANKRRLVRDPNRQSRSYRKPTDRYHEAMEKNRSGEQPPKLHSQRKLADRYREATERHHERQQRSTPTEPEKLSTPAERYHGATERHRRKQEPEQEKTEHKRQVREQNKDNGKAQNHDPTP